MKKILLGLLSLPILIISFSEAGSVYCEKSYCEGVGGYAGVIGSKTAYCFDYGDAIGLKFFLTSEYCEQIKFSNGSITRFVNCDKYPYINPFIDDGFVCVGVASNLPTGKSISLSVDFEYPPDPTLVPGGVIAFSGVVSNLVSSVSEFIPYVSYIGLGILGVVIGFFAIKWLIVRVRRKIFGSFKS